MSEWKVRLFGAFRNLQSDPMIQVRVPHTPCTVADLRAVLAERFRAQPAGSFDAAGLLGKAAIANDERVLLEDHVLQNGESLALLPPVSGG